MNIQSKAHFECLSAYEKGYAVYMFGCDNAEPHVPETYAPTPEEAADYARGQRQAVQDVQDGEE